VTATGDLVEVRLPENPSTGYRWEPASGVSEVVDAYYAQSSGPAVAGAGGTRVFRVRIEDVEEVLFVLRRSWEPPGHEPLEQRRVRIERA